MDYDDIVIGSGLAALGTVMGLLASPGRRIGVYCGPQAGQFDYYDARRSVPCAYDGTGGLGSFWHGVIPTRVADGTSPEHAAAVRELFHRFYPEVGARLEWGTPGMFVPWRAVRPAPEFQRLAESHADRLWLLQEPAQSLQFASGGVAVTGASGVRRAPRAWVAAGALRTPALLEPICPGAARECASDHAFCYLGQVAGQSMTAPRRLPRGLLVAARYDAGATALYSLRPARFGFRRLDFGIEQRAVFGMPTGNAVAKLARRLSPGLISEALFNRLGWPAWGKLQSAYAQVRVDAAYVLGQDGQALTPRPAAIRAATDRARQAQPFGGLRASRRPEIFLPGIHLHHTLDLAALRRGGVNLPDSPLQVVDASALEDIGPDHHSFRMMALAYRRGQQATA